jgi:uncharacterized protein
VSAAKELLRPPADEEVERALERFIAKVKGHYRDRLRGVYLAGSRARGDHQPASDVDVAVILADGDWRSWNESGVLSDLSYELLIQDGVDVQGVPIPLSHWENPTRHSNPSLVRTMKRDGKPLEPPA